MRTWYQVIRGKCKQRASVRRNRMAPTSFLKKIALAGILLGAFVFVVPSVNAQEDSDKPDRPKQTKARLTLLETQVDQLDETLKEVHGAEAPDHLRQRLSEIQGKLDDLSMQISEILARF